MRSFIRGKGVGRHVKPKVTPRIAYGQRDEVLLRLGYASYRDYLNSKAWSAIRQAVLSTTDKCEICQQATPAQVHHLSYSRTVLTGRNRKALVALCDGCHKRVEFGPDGRKKGFEAARKKTKRLLRKVGRWDEHTKHGEATG